MKSTFRPNNHIIGKVYDLTQENMNRLISLFEAQHVELCFYQTEVEYLRSQLAKHEFKKIGAQNAEV